MDTVAAAAFFGGDETLPQVHPELPAEEMLSADFISGDVPCGPDRESDGETCDQTWAEEFPETAADEKVNAYRKARQKNSEHALTENTQTHRERGGREEESRGCGIMACDGR